MDAKHRRLGLFERAYDETKNPLFAWRAYDLCLSWDVAPPAWVLAYLARVASEFARLSHPEAPPCDPAAALFDALEMKPLRPGPGNVLSQDERDFLLALEVQSLLDAGVHRQETYAIDDVVKIYEVSRSTVHRAWKRFEELFSGNIPPVS